MTKTVCIDHSYDSIFLVSISHSCVLAFTVTLQCMSALMALDEIPVQDQLLHDNTLEHELTVAT